MGTRIIGKLDDWDDADLGGNDFMSLDEGTNIVRIATSPYQFYASWTEDATGQTRKIRSSGENCPLVARGDKVTPRWMLGVLKRNEKTLGKQPKVLEVGRQIFQQIIALKKRDKWGDPRGYDINIERQPKGSQPLYVVMPEPKEALSDEEKSLIKESFASPNNPGGRIDLGKLTEAPTPEEVRRQLGIEEEPVKEVDNDFGSSDDDFDFGDM